MLRGNCWTPCSRYGALLGHKESRSSHLFLMMCSMTALIRSSASSIHWFQLIITLQNNSLMTPAMIFQFVFTWREIAFCAIPNHTLVTVPSCFRSLKRERISRVFEVLCEVLWASNARKTAWSDKKHRKKLQSMLNRGFIRSHSDDRISYFEWLKWLKSAQNHLKLLSDLLLSSA